MILCRFRTEGEEKYGLVENHHVREIAPDPFREFEAVGEPVPFAEVRILPPALPSKIVAVGINYKEHALEMSHALPEEPVLFMKPVSALVGSQDAIRLPKMSKQVDYEGELALVVKRRARDLKPEEAPAHILGYTCFNDVTARDLQKKDGQWTRSKSFDTFCPLGPWIVSDLDPSDLSVETYVNGERRQSGRTRDLIFSPAQILSFVSQVMTLEPGDVITTGTPKGVGPLQAGDVVDVKIEGIGILRNFVEAAA